MLYKFELMPEGPHAGLEPEDPNSGLTFIGSVMAPTTWGNHVLCNVYSSVSNKYPIIHLYVGNPTRVINWPIFHLGAMEQDSFMRAVSKAVMLKLTRGRFPKLQEEK